MTNNVEKKNKIIYAIKNKKVEIKGDSRDLQAALEFIIKKIEKLEDTTLKAWLHWRTQ